MGISLYTSRVVLQTLGIEDFGIYGVVGGVVSMFTFLNSSMSGATSRFLTFELGKKNMVKLRETFSTALLEHICIALIIVVIAETIGLWFLTNKLVIPENRLFAAQVVYQLSIISMILNVVQVPFSASVISHEKMNVFACIEISHSVLKLVIVYILLLGTFDKLILYSILMTLVSIIIFFSYAIYCRLHFEECVFCLLWRPDILKPMLSFSGWDIYGNMSVVARTQGVNMLLNIFFGPVMNAAASVATQVQGAVMAFSNSIITAFRPQVVKTYAEGFYNEMVILVSQAVRLNFMLMTLLIVPLIIKMDYILKLWLGDVPDYAGVFCSYTLLFAIFASMSTIIISGIHATGKIKRPSLINGTLYLLVVPFSYWAYSQSLPAWFAYLFNVVAVLLGMLSNAYTLYLYVPHFSVSGFLKYDFFRCVLVFLITFFVSYSVSTLVDNHLFSLLLTTSISTVLVFVLGYFFLLSPQLKNKINQLLKVKICRKA